MNIFKLCGRKSGCDDSGNVIFLIFRALCSL